MIGVRVQGGTYAGHKRPPAEAAPAWSHYCKGTNPPREVILSGRFRNCPACYTRRPNE